MNYQKKALEVLQFKKWPRSDWSLPRLQSHRGFWVEGARENSLASMAAAKKKNFQMAEFDVRMTSDQVPVMIHDKNLVRLFGVRLKISQIHSRDLAKWEIPTLAEVLKTKNRPPLLNIEIKNDDRLDGVLEKKVIDVVKDSRKKGEILFSAFNPLSLKVCAEEIPEVPRALLIALDRWNPLSYFRVIGNVLAHANMVNWPHQLLNQPLVEYLKKAGVPIATWTMNDYRKANEYFSWGVDSVISDRLTPDKI